MEADDRASLQGPQWLTSLLLELAPFLQYGQTPQTELLIAFHLRTPTHPHSEWETHTHHVASSPSCQIKRSVQIRWTSTRQLRLHWVWITRGNHLGS